MSFERTSGSLRAYGILISRTVNGVTSTYTSSMLDPFSWNGTEYLQLTEYEFERLDRDSQYIPRRDAFIAYMQTMPKYKGFTIDMTASITEDPNGIYFVN